MGVIDLTCEPRRDVLDIRENKIGGGGEVISKFNYGVNSLGQRTAVSMSGTAFAATSDYTWGYDALGQVTSADHTDAARDRTYTYDAIGNRTRSTKGTAAPVAYATNAYSKSWTDTDDYGIPDVGESAETLKYDLDGNLSEDGAKKYASRISTTAGTRSLNTKAPAAPPKSVRRTRYWGLDLSGTRQEAGGVSGLISTSEWTCTCTGTGTGTAVTSASSESVTLTV